MNTNSAVLTHIKMQYACRKTLADSRPRVRGRFAKNDELCEAAQSGSQGHEHYEQTVSFQLCYSLVKQSSITRRNGYSKC